MKSKIIFSSLVLLTSFLLFNPVFNIAQAAQFELGEHYVEVKGIQSNTPQVTEFFSFYCPHCYKSEPFMHKVKALLPNPNQFIKNHVDGMPGRKIEIEHLLTKALITADLLNVKETIVQSIFSYIHQGKADFSELKDIKNLFLLKGVDSQEFDKTFGSFNVNMAANTMRNKTDLLRKQGFTKVPTLIINGKYKPNTESLKSMDEYLKLIAFLLTKTA